MTVEDTGYNIATKVAGKHKGVLILALMMITVVMTLLGGYTIMIGGIRVSIENGEQEGGLPVLREEFEAHVEKAKVYAERVDPILNIVIKDGIRIIEKLADRIVSNPDQVREGDMIHIINTLWPAIPDEFKTGTLTAQYQLVVDHYNQSIGNGG